MTDESSNEISFKTYHPFSELEKIQELWLDLEKRSEHSYFTSWGWISVWLASLPSDIKITLHVGYQNQQPMVAFFLGERKSRKYRFLPTASFALNATAHHYYDNLYIEYNSILYDSSVNINFNTILRYLLNLGWDELLLSGVSHKFVADFNFLREKEKKFHVLVTQDTNSFYVNLQKIRDDDMDFLKSLSSNRRSQIRRSLKQYQSHGDIHIQEAASIQEALVFLDQLAHYHQSEWKKRGWAGAFANEYLYQFHKDLIQKRFEKDEIQLLHIYTDQMDIGYIYSFVYNGDVLFYQSGFNYQENNNYRPGLISHYLAILHNAKKNMKTYDFLAGDSSYKQTFASDSKPLYWLRVYKNKPRYQLDKTLLRLKNKSGLNNSLSVNLKKIITSLKNIVMRRTK